jgi:hypothetical protein
MNFLSDKHVYVASTSHEIVRMNFDGSDAVIVVKSGFVAHALDVDLEHGYLYWGDRTTPRLRHKILL